MRALLIGVALALVSGSASAQRVDQVGLEPSVESTAITSASLAVAPVLADASRPWLPAPAAPAAMGRNGGRIAAILIGAVIGAGVVYGGVRSMNCSDCKGSAATYGAIGGAMVGGFIGSTVYSFRQRKAVTPPASFTR